MEDFPQILLVAVFNKLAATSLLIAKQKFLMLTGYLYTFIPFAA